MPSCITRTALVGGVMCVAAACGSDAATNGADGQRESVVPVSTTESVVPSSGMPTDQPAAVVSVADDAGPTESASDGDVPHRTDERVDPAELNQIQVTGLRGATATLMIGPRPSGEPGFCVLEAFPSLQGVPTCFASDSSGRLFVPIRNDAADVLVFMHPDVVRVEHVVDDVAEDEPMSAIDGLDGVWVTVSPNDDDAVRSAFAADGSTVYIAEYFPQT